jgi:ribonuclease HI
MGSEQTATVHIDGAARGNPGPAAYAVVLARPGEPVLEEAEPLGTATNNVAEYTALVRALEIARDLGVRRLTVFSDSELVVKQMNGEYRVKNADLLDLYTTASDLRRAVGAVTLTHVRREQNKRADFLCNEALDGRPRALGPAADPPPAAKPKPAASPPAKAVPDTAVRDDALACLAAAADRWASHGRAGLPVEQVWEQLWSVLEEGGVLRKKK